MSADFCIHHGTYRCPFHHLEQSGQPGRFDVKTGEYDLTYTDARVAAEEVARLREGIRNIIRLHCNYGECSPANPLDADGMCDELQALLEKKP